MAMIKCKECGEQVSEKAKTCPKCGIKNPAPAGYTGMAIILVITALIFIISKSGPSTNKTSASPAAPSVTTITEKALSPEEKARMEAENRAIQAGIEKQQAQRKEFIDKAFHLGFVHKINHPDSLPRVYVGHTFWQSNITDKNKFLGIMLDYYATNNPKTDMLVLYDGNNGKQIGVYRHGRGLRMD